MSVILNEVKNLVESMGWKTEILRLMPQNDVTTQSPREEGYQKSNDDYFRRTAAGPVDDLTPDSICFFVQCSIRIRA